MKKKMFNLILGIALIAFGVVFILDNFGLLPLDIDIVSIAVLLALGLAFLVHSLKRKEDWKGIIPGIILTTLGLVSLFSYFDLLADELLGVVVLAGFGLSFLALLLIKRSEEWAIYPAGIFLALSATVLADYIFFRGLITGAVYLAGSGVLFLFLFLSRKKEWAIYPAWFFFALAGTVFAQFLFDLGGVTGGVFLVGSGFLFLFLFLSKEKKWAVYPAWFLILPGIVSASTSLPFSNIGGIAGGIFLWGLGLFFFYLYRKYNQFALCFIGFTSLVLGVVASVATYPGIPSPLAGTVFLGGSGIDFLLLYLLDRRNWWGVFLFGLFATLSLFPADAAYSWWLPVVKGFVFFLGMAISFLLLSLISIEGKSFRWARGVAVLFAFISLLVLVGGRFPDFADFIVPIALISFGGYLVVRWALGAKKGSFEKSR
jgi:hypothetical protein